MEVFLQKFLKVNLFLPLCIFPLILFLALIRLLMVLLVLLDGDLILILKYFISLSLSFLSSPFAITNHYIKVYLGNVKTHGLLSHPTQPILNIPLPPLVDMGFFDILFRDAFKEHLNATNKANLCPFVDLIIDIFYSLFCILHNFNNVLTGITYHEIQMYIRRRYASAQQVYYHCRHLQSGEPTYKKEEDCQS